MTKLIYLIAIAFVASSCATLVARKEYVLTLHTNVPNSKVEVNDSVFNIPTQFKVTRSKADLKIKLTNDSLEKYVRVKSFPNPSFLYGNLLFLYVSPAAYLVDFTNPRRFYYGNDIFLNVFDTITVIRQPIHQVLYDYFAEKVTGIKGALYLTLSFPWVNNFYLQPIDEVSMLNTGFIGMSVGAEYHYQNKKYISLEAGALLDFLIPFPAPIDYWGEYETMHSLYVSLSDNIKLNHFTVGYGVSFSSNTWALHVNDFYDTLVPSLREPTVKTNQSLGFYMDGYHQFSETVSVGVKYRPSILMIKPQTSWKYEHLISLDLEIKIPVHH
jgi:hypothetical protein